MKDIGDYIDDEYDLDPQKTEDEAPHERAYWIEKTRKKLGTDKNGDEYDFGYVLGRTQHLDTDDIRLLYYKCKKEADDFAALWSWLLSESDRYGR